MITSRKIRLQALKEEVIGVLSAIRSVEQGAPLTVLERQIGHMYVPINELIQFNDINIVSLAEHTKQRTADLGMIDFNQLEPPI